MTLTNRGNIVVAIICTIAFVALLALVGRVEADTQCATFQANNDYQSAINAGCSFDILPNGEYPYTWEVK